AFAEKNSAPPRSLRFALFTPATDAETTIHDPLDLDVEPLRLLALRAGPAPAEVVQLGTAARQRDLPRQREGPEVADLQFAEDPPPAGADARIVPRQEPAVEQRRQPVDVQRARPPRQHDEEVVAGVPPRLVGRRQHVIPGAARVPCSL